MQAERDASFRALRRTQCEGTRLASKHVEHFQAEQSMATIQKRISGTQDKAANGPGTRSASQTGERDENYNLISILYHSLQGADTCTQYMKDASDDDELQEFLEDTRAEYSERATQVKRLLVERLGADQSTLGSSDDDPKISTT